MLNSAKNSFLHIFSPQDKRHWVGGGGRGAMAAISPRPTTTTTTTTTSFCVAKRKKGNNEKDREFQSRNYEKAVTKVKMLLFYPF